MTNLNEFSQTIDNVLIRHRSILDIMTKLQESNAKINRAIAKAVTECGCIQIHAQKQDPDTGVDYSDLTSYMSNHIEGDLCEPCREKLMEEIGDNLFYLMAACNALKLEPNAIMQKKLDEITTLGQFSMF